MIEVSSHFFPAFHSWIAIIFTKSSELPSEILISAPLASSTATCSLRVGDKWRLKLKFARRQLEDAKRLQRWHSSWRVAVPIGPGSVRTTTGRAIQRGALTFAPVSSPSEEDGLRSSELCLTGSQFRFRFRFKCGWMINLPFDDAPSGDLA